MAASLSAQTWTPKQSDRPQPVTGEEPGFQSIYDGKTLTGWEGDPKYWRVGDDGNMTGEITPETVIRSNTFIIWRGGSPADFELKVDYRITAAGNSGINYRSKMVPDMVTTTNKYAMRGYQCDIDGGNRYTGNNYEEKGRLFLGVRGQVSRVTGVSQPSVLSTIGDSTELGTKVKTGDWNAVHLIARGTTLMHIINGQLMCMVIDDDAAGRSASGLLGVQVHVGPPMKVEYRRWRLKTL